VLAAAPELAESDIVTRWPSGIGVTSTTFLVSRACALLMLVTTWYTHVSPTATGSGIDPAATTEPGLAVGVAAAVALVVAVPLEAAAGGGVGAPAGHLPRGRSAPAGAGARAPGREPHPASATAAAPTRTARADVYLLMVMRTAQG